MTVYQKFIYVLGAYNLDVVCLFVERLSNIERSSLLYEMKYIRGFGK